MSEGTPTAGQASGLVGELDTPWIGLLAIFITFMWKPAAHTVSVVNHLLFPGTAHYISGAVIGAVGFVLVWTGFRRDELTGTCLGFMGGSAIFMGLVEPSFMLFSELMAVAPLVDGEKTVLGPNLLLMEASAVSYFVILIFLGADKDTRCRMFLWFHRNLRLRPNAPTPGYKRQPARIAAMEAVLISWFFYILIITLCDPRIFGRDHLVTIVLFPIMLGWGLWLVFAKLTKFRSMAAALRYSIPVSGILWFNMEMAAQWRWYTEVWIKPVEFPLSNVLIGILFLTGGVVANLTTKRGGEGKATVP